MAWSKISPKKSIPINKYCHEEVELAQGNNTYPSAIQKQQTAWMISE